MKLDKKDLVLCAQAALNCYKNSSFFKKYKCKFKKVFDKTKRFDVDTVQGYFGYISSRLDTLWVVFRGSEEEEKGNADWKTNSKFAKITFKKRTKIQVHEGFLIYYKKVKKKIIKEAKKYRNIIVTGHSLGGALATLCAENLDYLFPDKDITGVPLSSPRVGNKAFVDSYNRGQYYKTKNSYRVFYGDDSVVRTPLLLMGYRHVKTQYHLKKNYWLPWNWFTFICSWPWDHRPDILLKKIKEQL